jgi:hypothetical protein
VVLPSSEPWNRLAARLIEYIRSIDNQHWIMVGGNYYNAISTLKEITIFDDSRIVYTFHFYEPMLFTHQKAPWVPVLHQFNRTLAYPGPVSGLREFLQENPQRSNDYQISAYVDLIMDKADLEKRFQDAVDFLRLSGKPLYCGEFGSIDLAPMQSRINWNHDLISLCNQHGIGKAYWSYKAMDFGVVDLNGQIINEDLIKTIVA